MWLGEPHPFPQRGSPTRLSTSGQQSYKGRSCRLFHGTISSVTSLFPFILILMYLAVGWLKLQSSLYHTDSLLLHTFSSVRNCKQFFLLGIHNLKLCTFRAVRRHLIQWVCYNELSYNERMLKRTVFINKIRLLQQTPTTIGRRSTRMRMTCRAFPLWLEHSLFQLSAHLRI